MRHDPPTEPTLPARNVPEAESGDGQACEAAAVRREPRAPAGSVVRGPAAPLAGTRPLNGPEAGSGDGQAAREPHSLAAAGGCGGAAPCAGRDGALGPGGRAAGGVIPAEARGRRRGVAPVAGGGAMLPAVRGFAVRTGVLVRLNATVLLREPGPLIGRLVMPVLMLLAMRPLYEAAQGTAEGTAQAVTGALVMFSLLALSVVGTSLLSERVWGTWDRLRATPAGAAELLLGKAVPVFCVLAVQQAVVLGFGVLVLGMPVAAPALVLAAGAAWGLALLGIGAALGVIARSHGQLAALHDIGALVLTTLGGALVPLATLPAWVRTLAPGSPGYWAARTLRRAAAGDTAGTFTGVAVLLAVAVAAAGVAGWRVSRGWGRATAV